MAIDLSAWVVIANQRVPKTNLVTDWFCGEVAPVHIGFYQRYFVDGVFIASMNLQSESVVRFRPFVVGSVRGS